VRWQQSFFFRGYYRFEDCRQVRKFFFGNPPYFLQIHTKAVMDHRIEFALIIAFPSGTA
jgi:hypothetical protein